MTAEGVAQAQAAIGTFKPGKPHTRFDVKSTSFKRKFFGGLVGGSAILYLYFIGILAEAVADFDHLRRDLVPTGAAGGKSKGGGWIASIRWRLICRPGQGAPWIFPDSSIYICDGQTPGHDPSICRVSKANRGYRRGYEVSFSG